MTFFYVVKVTKSSHHLSHDRASKGMGLILVWRHRLICIVLILCKHACKEVCDVKQGVDPYPLLARSCDRWWPDFVTFTACKRSIFGFKRGKKAQCISNRCKDLFKRKKYFGDMGTLIWQCSFSLLGDSCYMYVVHTTQAFIKQVGKFSLSVLQLKYYS